MQSEYKPVFNYSNEIVNLTIKHNYIILNKINRKKSLHPYVDPIKYTRIKCYNVLVFAKQELDRLNKWLASMAEFFLDLS